MVVYDRDLEDDKPDSRDKHALGPRRPVSTDVELSGSENDSESTVPVGDSQPQPE